MEPLTQRLTVRWADLDPNGHVRHSVYYDFGSQVRIGYLHQRGCGLDWMTRHGFGPILFREEARFYREIKLGDDLFIDTWVIGLSADHRKWSMRHAIRRGEELCATVEIEGAWIDLKQRRITAPPQELLQIFEGQPRSDDFRIIPSGTGAVAS